MMQQVAMDIQNARVLDQFIESCKIRDISEEEWNEIVKKREAEHDAKIAEVKARAAARAAETGDRHTGAAGQAEASIPEATEPESSASDAT